MRAGHKARNDSPAFHDLKPQALPVDYGTHAIWCHRVGHDGPCAISFAVTDPNGVRVKLTVGYDDAASDTTVTVEVGGRAAVLDGDSARRTLTRLTGWLSPSTRTRPKVKP
ncbi:hypothetical protein [Micromonospora profundi]|uniref:hypothetical protein n=1 Tax=Micromonospora profundi TaxID=1420889 RepID=UPI0036687E23